MPTRQCGKLAGVKLIPFRCAQKILGEFGFLRIFLCSQNPAFRDLFGEIGAVYFFSNIILFQGVKCKHPEL
jgi:hypothetical protein